MHRFRSEESAIMAGNRTLLKDNPALTTRDWAGKNPLRIVIDRDLSLPESLRIFEPPAHTLVFNSKKEQTSNNLTYASLEFSGDIFQQMFKYLFKKGIQSMIIEGGPALLNEFITRGVWDEARVFYGNILFGRGIKAPTLDTLPVAEEWIENDVLKFYRNYASGQLPA